MAIGRTFKEALQKGIRSLEIGRYGLGSDGKDIIPDILDTWGNEKSDRKELLSEIKEKLSIPQAERLFYLKHAFQLGMSLEEVAELTSIDPWFLHNIKEIVEVENEIT